MICEVKSFLWECVCVKMLLIVHVILPIGATLSEQLLRYVKLVLISLFVPISVKL